MHVVSLRPLREFWLKHPEAKQPLLTWYHDVTRSSWPTPQAIKADHRTASILPNNRVVFDIRGNNCRVVTVVHYNRGNLYVRFVGTHTEYDRIDALTI